MPGLYDIPIAIADILITLTSPLSAVELGIEQRLGPFFGLPDEPQGRVALRWEASEEPPSPPGDLIYDPGLIWKMYRAATPNAGGDYYAALSYQAEGRPAPVQGLLRANADWTDLTLTEQRLGAPWQSLLSIGAGELILRAAILLTGGLILHASGLDDNGQGLLFVGHSGAGKSTQVGLWSQEPGVSILNEDRTAVRVNERGARCYGIPWGGNSAIARNHAAPLAAILMLEQAPVNELQPLAPTAAASLLSARAFLPYWDPALMRRALENLSALLQQVPVYRLRCRPERAVIPLVRSLYR
jgi:hypothetical protein